MSDTQLGLLGSVFMLVHSLASVPLGMLADKYSRRLLITAGELLSGVLLLSFRYGYKL